MVRQARADGGRWIRSVGGLLMLLAFVGIAEWVHHLQSAPDRAAAERILREAERFAAESGAIGDAADAAKARANAATADANAAAAEWRALKAEIDRLKEQVR